ncbi:SAM-dependent methyltransferase [Mesorhizobium sp. Cs1299R1N1]|uniref:SAM-dependent methyltransferase n=1 Tax=Mesorhizobium sp. Cs1299R1N1 TaxID=3015172 RepID=UPI003FA58627
MIADRSWETVLAEHDSRHWPHLELATDDPWRFDGNPFEGRRHPQALDLSLTQGSVTYALQIGCAFGAFDEAFRPAAISSGSSLRWPEQKNQRRERMNEPQHACLSIGEVRWFLNERPFGLIIVPEVLHGFRGHGRHACAHREAGECARVGWESDFGSARDALIGAGTPRWRRQRDGHVTQDQVDHERKPSEPSTNIACSL